MLLSLQGNTPPAILALADGTVYLGNSIGAAGSTVGEVVFNTSMTGYQEILTDPSYCQQIVTLTYPHIGNYGVAGVDDEARRPWCRGVIVREMARRHSNQRAEDSLDAMLHRFGISGIAGLDTRAEFRALAESRNVGTAAGVGRAAVRAVTARQCRGRRQGRENRGHALHLRPKPHVVIPLVPDLKILDAAV